MPNSKSVMGIRESRDKESSIQNLHSIMSSASPPNHAKHRSIGGKDSSVDRMSQRTQADISELTEIISACNFLCDKYINEDEEDNVSRKLDKHLTRREKFIY